MLRTCRDLRCFNLVARLPEFKQHASSIEGQRPLTRSEWYATCRSHPNSRCSQGPGKTPHKQNPLYLLVHLPLHSANSSTHEIKNSSNTTKESSSSLLRKLRGMGFKLEDRELITSLSACRQLVEDRRLK